MHLKGRLRRLLSTSSGVAGAGQAAERSRRMSDVSENSDISYDRSSGSFVQRVTSSLRSRSSRLRRTASESAALEGGRESYDGGSFAYPDPDLDLGSSTRPSPFRAPIPLSEVDGSKKDVYEPRSSSDVRGDATATAAKALGNAAHAVNAVGVIKEEGEEKDGEEEEEDGPVPSAWGEKPSPEQLQIIQDRVSAWLDKSRTSPPSTSTSGLRFPSTIETNATLLEVPEESEDAEEQGQEEQEENDLEVDDNEPLTIRKQPLRMLDSISEDEVPGFVGSSVSTAPSTPLPPLINPQQHAAHLQHLQISRSRSQSPPLRRRSLEAGQDEYHMRGLDTIQEAGDTAPRAQLPPSPRGVSTSLPPPSPRRSLDSMKRPTMLALESIPEIDLPPPKSPFASSSSSSSLSTGLGAAKRRFGVKGFGFTRSESEPLMPTIRSVPFNPNISSMTSTISMSTPGLNVRKPKRKAPPSLNVLIGGKPPGAAAAFRSATTTAVKEGTGTLAGPGLPSFQRGASVVTGQWSTPAVNALSGSSSTNGGVGRNTPPFDTRKPMDLRAHSLGSIAVLTEQIEDEESRRLTEAAFLT